MGADSKRNDGLVVNSNSNNQGGTKISVVFMVFQLFAVGQKLDSLGTRTDADHFNVRGFESRKNVMTSY